VKITGLRLRGILDSSAQPTVEAEICLDGTTGRGSCAVAIKPGRLEKRRRLHVGALGDLTSSAANCCLRDALVGKVPADQEDLDTILEDLDDRHGLGADLTLAVSLAYARASATVSEIPLYRLLAEAAGARPSVPRLLVNVFSGGIHRRMRAESFQQIMILTPGGDLPAVMQMAMDAYAHCERLAGEPRLSASSGLLVPGRDTAWQLATLSSVPSRPALGIDVAAEHLATGNGTYRFEEQQYEPGAFAELLTALAAQHHIKYIEDPFDPADIAAWENFLPEARSAGITVVGDDLFVTDSGRVRPGLADAMLLKLSQAGTLTATLRAARAARLAGLKLAVSHRSGETEDCTMCDLAVAIGADYIKVGGPRRGDRIAKYNQLLRLAEAVCGNEEETRVTRQ
jgi:enolase